MDINKFDLQLFNDGEGNDGTPVDGGQAQATDNSDTASSVSTAEELLNGPEAFVIDEQGNFKWLTGKEAEEALKSKQSTPAATSDTEGSTPNPAAAEEQPSGDSDGTADAGDQNLVTVKVDGQEVKVPLEEALRGYIRQEKFTREMQKLAEERKQIESMRQKPPQTENPPAGDKPNPFEQNATDDVPPIDKVNFADFRQTNDYITKRAIAEAKKELGVDQLLEVEFSHIAAFQQARDKVAQEVSQYIDRGRSLNNLERELRAEEPAFDEVFEFAMSKADKLPHNEYVAIQNAFNTGDTATIRKYFMDSRKEYYAKLTGVPTTPKPVAVARGGEKDALTESSKPKKADPTDLRGMTAEEQRKWLMDNVGGF
ncbi:hypothetical protein [Anaeroselena agilis]|uniref:Scaffolding protein n=1 Tax=Anaeroselena agilis TaxID=3063788 RepID=A0ABU3NXG4_9FIRM|nr:hypothetical protein [Selenomonadales bacterium 4137-cl]